MMIHKRSGDTTQGIGGKIYRKTPDLSCEKVWSPVDFPFSPWNNWENLRDFLLHEPRKRQRLDPPANIEPNGEIPAPEKVGLG